MYESCHALILCIWYFAYVIFNTQTTLTPTYHFPQLTLEDGLSQKYSGVQMHCPFQELISCPEDFGWGGVLNMGDKVQY